MTLNDEIKLEVGRMSDALEIVEVWEGLADKLSNAFDWKGSKIDWAKVKNHDFLELKGGLKDWAVLVVEFVERKAREGLLKGSPSIFYISDSALDFAVRFEISVLPDFVSFAVVNVPQHHYIFDEAVSWCVVVSSEGYVDFGIPLKP